jgi:phosphatidylglycerol:prolipoprotein diacylglycerol transferase
VLQTLFHIPNQIGGVPLFGLGLLLALWAVGSAVFLIWLGRRQGFNADTWGYAPLLVLVGAAIWLVVPHLCDAYGLPIRGYGVMLLLAVSAAVGLAAWRARRVGLDPELIFSLAFWLFLPGLLGARIFYVIQKWPIDFEPIYQAQGFAAVLGAVVNIAQGGLVVYGSLIGGVLGAIAFIYKYKLPPLAMLDLITPSLLLGLAIGRLGCMMNGCCYGGPCTLPWAVTFPAGSPVHVHQFFDGELAVYGLKLAEPPQLLPWITDVEPGSAAQQAGVAAKQWIDSIDKLPIDNAQGAYWALLEGGQSARALAIQTVRGQEHRWRAGSSEAAPLAQPNGSLQGLKFVGADEERPIIGEVASGSEAEKQGLRIGQELFAVNGQRVRTVAAARQTLAQVSRPGARVSLITVAGRSTAEMAISGPVGRSMPVHPTQIYGAVNGLVLCLFLLAYDPFRRRDGELWALFLTIYPITRFLLEIIRTDEPSVFHTGMSISQNVSLILLACAVALWIAILLKPAGTAFPKYRAADG